MGILSNFNNKSRTIYLAHMLDERCRTMRSECDRRGLGDELRAAIRRYLKAAYDVNRHLSTKKQISTAESMLGKAEFTRHRDLINSTATFLIAIWIEALGRSKAYSEWFIEYHAIADAAEQLLEDTVRYGAEERELMYSIFRVVGPDALVRAREEGRQQALESLRPHEGN